MLKQEIAQLKTTIAMAVEQIMHTIASLHDNHHPSMPNAMETELDNQNPANLNTTKTIPSHQLDLPAIINELKNNIATISNKTQALFQQYLPLSTNNTPYSSIT